MTEDESHLDSLAIAHYVIGGLMALFACFPLFHMFIGLSIALGIGEMGQALDEAEGSGPPAFFGWFFFGMGFMCFLLGQATAISVMLSGRFIKQRKNYLFTFILACVACMFVPIGTILGVFTIIVLSRESVKTLYGRT